MGLPPPDSADSFRHRTDDWRACFAKFGPRLLLFARQIVPCLADAEDAVQEGFIRFWRKGGLRASGNHGLLFAAVRSAALDHLRRESRRQRREQTALEENLLPGIEAPHEPALELRDDPQASSRELERAPGPAAVRATRGARPEDLGRTHPRGDRRGVVHFLQYLRFALPLRAGQPEKILHRDLP